MTEHDMSGTASVETEAADLLRQQPSLEELVELRTGLVMVLRGIRRRGDGWTVAAAFRRIVGDVDPAVGRQRLQRAVAVIAVAAAMLEAAA